MNKMHNYPSDISREQFEIIQPDFWNRQKSNCKCQLHTLMQMTVLALLVFIFKRF